jgi:hypothetical protein
VLTDPQLGSETDHVTVVVDVPVTTAANGIVPPTTTVAAVGVTSTATWPGVTGSVTEDELPQPARSPADRRAAAASRRVVTVACLSRVDNQARKQ